MKPSNLILVSLVRLREAGHNIPTPSISEYNLATSAYHILSSRVGKCPRFGGLVFLGLRI